MDSNGNNHCDCMHSANTLAVHHWYDPKIIPTTIITTLIVIVFRQVIISKNTTNQESLLQILLVTVITHATTSIIFKNIVSESSEKMEEIYSQLYGIF